MRRGQASAELVLAMLLVGAVAAGGLLAGKTVWFAAELQVARVAADQAASRGHDRFEAAGAAVPPGIRAEIMQHLDRPAEAAESRQP